MFADEEIKMRNLFLLFSAITLVVSGLAMAVGTIQVSATQGKACDWRYADTVMGNTTQLMTRNGGGTDCKKSWLQFDLTSVYAANPSIKGHILDAKLTVFGAKSETGTKSYAVSGLNDAANLENWEASALTWNNGPGNDITNAAALDVALTTSFYTLSIPVPVLDVLSETPETNRAALKDFLNTDTDGKVTFIFTAGQTTYLWNAGEDVSPELVPFLTLTYEQGKNPFKAHEPDPADDGVAPSSMAALSWVNPDPNTPGNPIYCDVYLGTDPNRAQMISKTLANNVTQVALAGNFGSFSTLVNDQKYYWIVDCHDADMGLIPGEVWSFTAGEAPSVNAGTDQIIWLTTNPLIVNLDGTVSDDSGNFTVQWAQVANGAPAVTPSPDNTVDTTISITARGDYEFRLTADDGLIEASDTVRITVGTDSCDASHIYSREDYPAGDMNRDCIVDLTDLSQFAANWLVDTDTQQ